ncbi:putative cytoplasmic protein [Vibrio astriarenae]|nr:putative cytoplasmic protein [Vibrio sp. C7]
MLVYPNANIPIVQVSIDANAGTEYNHRLGKALRSLREQEVLMIGSGGISHNLQAYFSLICFQRMKGKCRRLSIGCIAI